MFYTANIFFNYYYYTLFSQVSESCRLTHNLSLIVLSLGDSLKFRKWSDICRL